MDDQRTPREWLTLLEVRLVRLPALAMPWRRKLHAQWDPLLRQITLFEHAQLTAAQRVQAFVHELIHVQRPELSEDEVIAATEAWLSRFDTQRLAAWNAELLDLAAISCVEVVG